MFNTRTNASTSSPTGIMMTTDPSMFYSSFPPPSSCDFNVRSTIVRKLKYNKKKLFQNFYFFVKGKYNVISISIPSTTKYRR
jgi:hypothetical protein